MRTIASVAYHRLFAITALALAACESESGSAPPIDLPMQIVVSEHEVSVYMEAADLGTCDCSEVTFPAPGTCTLTTDANPCSGNPVCRSCLTDIHVEVDGAPLAPDAGGTIGTDPWRAHYAFYPVGALELVIEGCGHLPTRIPLDAIAFPKTTVVAEWNIDTHTPRARWTVESPSPAPETLVTLRSEFGSTFCRTSAASEHTFTSVFGRSIEAEPLFSHRDIETEVGFVTVWRAGFDSADLPSRPF